MQKVMVRSKKRSKEAGKSAVPSESRSKLQVFAPSPAILGICSTCNYAESCSFRRDTPRPVLECDEFDDRVDVPRRLPRPDLQSIGPSESASELYKGLCINCEVRATCMLRPPGMTVWHCEEYQ